MKKVDFGLVGVIVTVILLIVICAFWVSVAYVAAHFIIKFW